MYKILHHYTFMNNNSYKSFRVSLIPLLIFYTSFSVIRREGLINTQQQSTIPLRKRIPFLRANIQNRSIVSDELNESDINNPDPSKDLMRSSEAIMTSDIS